MLEQSKVGPLQVKRKAEDLAVGQRERLGIISRSESTGKIFQGGDASGKKLPTEAVQPFTEKVKVQLQQVFQKEKSSVTPRSQPAGQPQGPGGQKLQTPGGQRKHNVLTQEVQQFKGKSKVQDWGSSAGTSAPFRAPR